MKLRKSVLGIDAKLHLFFVGTILLASLIAAQALFHEGLYSAHDIWHQVARLYHFVEALKDTQIPPVWISQLAHGYGYPLFLFSYHLPWIIGAPFALLGVSIENTIKILFFLSFFLSGLSMYVSSFFMLRQKFAACVAALVYLWAPYHFLTIFVSAAIGTAFQFVCIPLIFAGIYLISNKRPRVGVLFLSFSIAGSILSHLMTFVFVAPFAALFGLSMILAQPSRARFKKTLLLGFSALLGFLLSAYYVVPLLAYTQYIIAGNAGNGFSDIYISNFVTLKQLLYSKWGFGPIVSNAKDGEISFSVGIVQWLAVASGLIVVTMGLLKHSLITTSRFSQKTWLLLTTMFLFAISIVGMLEVSKPVWSLIQTWTTLDYPFRLLVISVYTASFLLGLSITYIKMPWMRIVFGIVCFVLALYTNRNHLKVNMYTDFPLSLYIESETTTNTFHEYLPKTANASFLSEATPAMIIAPQAISIDNLEENTRQSLFDITLNEPSEVVLRAFAFPGQSVYVNNTLTKHHVTTDGLMALRLPKGTHTILRTYEPTGLQQLAGLMSITGLFIAARFVYSTKKIRK